MTVLRQGFTTGGAKAATRFAVDIPIADPGAAAAIDLVKSLITGLPAGSRSQVVVVHADDAAAQLARSTGAYKSAGGGVYSLAQAAGGGVRLLGLLLLVGLQPRDGPAAAKLVAEAWSGPALVLVNAAPAEPSVLSPPPAEYSQLLDEALVAYSFLPVAVRVSGSTGAMC